MASRTRRSGSVNHLGAESRLSTRLTVSPPVCAGPWFFWVNWFASLLNVVLVGFPLDGGRSCRASCGPTRLPPATLRPSSPASASCSSSACTHRVQEPLALCLAAVHLRLVPAAVDHAGDGRRGGLFGYDFSQGYTSLERDGPGRPAAKPKQSWWQRWMQRRAERKAQRARPSAARPTNAPRRAARQGRTARGAVAHRRGAALHEARQRPLSQQESRVTEPQLAGLTAGKPPAASRHGWEPSWPTASTRARSRASATTRPR